MNTGEGGVSPYHLESGADLVFQIGTAKYGVRDENGDLSDRNLSEVADIEHVKMFEIKLSQGAKPGKGGILPGKKVTKDIAKMRGIAIGKDSISPNRHIEIDNLEQLLAMVNRVREITGKPVGFKCVVGADFVVSARGFMFALGCIQALQCNKNTCPTGITTHNKRLQKGLNVEEKAVRVASDVKNMVYEVGVIAHSCGVREPRQLRRFHSRIVVEKGNSVSLEDYYKIGK